MTKEEKFKEAKELYKTANADQRYVLEILYPELKESEDERVRKALVDFFSKGAENGEMTNNIADKDIIAWLEKQGKTTMEATNEEKVEPKFKVDDWVVTDKNNTVQIKSIVNGYYVLDNAMKFTIDYVDKCWHFWTIQDAKDGDVLSYRDGQWLFIYKDKIDENSYKYYVLSSEKDININDSAYTLLTSSIVPATKEQHDTLMIKMKEAGYEWDIEKRKLRKIENQPIEEVNDEDYGIDGLYHAQRILEKTLGKVDGYQTDDGILDHKAAITAVKKLCEQKPSEWSEEDEKVLSKILSVLNVQVCWDGVTGKKMNPYQDAIDWLKSLKPQNHWKPSEQQMKALHDLNISGEISYIGQGPILLSLYNDLKKLTE